MKRQICLKSVVFYANIKKKEEFSMNRKKAMTTMGYAIVSVIVLGIIMIISAPMIINGNKNKNNADSQEYQEDRRDYDKYSSDDRSVDVVAEMQNIESRLNSRINDIEARQNNQSQQNYSNNNNSNVTNKYVCSMEGTLDSDNNVIPLNSQQPSSSLQNQKIVFVCEYRN